MRIKKEIIFLGLAALLLAAVLTSCTGSDPKALAKETYELSQQTMASLLNPVKTAELTKKALEIEKKVQALSDSNKQIYTMELAKLTGQGTSGLLDAASNLSGDDIQQVLDSSQKTLDTAQQALDLLGSFGN